MKATEKGQTTVEFALAFAGVLLPLTFGVTFTAALLWVWHSVNELTREGASYAATHCWQSDSSNVINFMQANLPPMVAQDQFQNGQAQINVSYFALDPASGTLMPFACDAAVSANCEPDTVTVSVTGFEWRTFVTTALGLPPVPIPNFQTSLPVESAGVDPEEGTCVP
ncbi:MAG: pilus assembly protein [Acidobacteriia bacterium]|nr:pilus assembly protein [Terriglobia bacterium]